MNPYTGKGYILDKDTKGDNVIIIPDLDSPFGIKITYARSSGNIVIGGWYKTITYTSKLPLTVFTFNEFMRLLGIQHGGSDKDATGDVEDGGA